jgi:hypothetical protein
MKYPKLFHLVLPLVCLNSTLLASQPAGTTYVSNTGETNFGSYGVAGGDWLAQPFITGTSPGGYSLDAVDLVMGSGQPGVTNFQLGIYSTSTFNFKPAYNLETLTGDSNPFFSGIYTYTSSGIILNPNTQYWIVASASNSSGNNGFSAYYWGLTRDTVFSSNDGWQIPFGATHAVYYTAMKVWTLYSSDTYGTQQFAIEATAVPEPGLSALLSIGLIFGLKRKVGREE